MFYDGDHSAGHEPSRAYRSTGSGHLRDFNRPPNIGNVHPTTGPGRRDLEALHGSTDVYQDFHSITSHHHETLGRTACLVILSCPPCSRAVLRPDSAVATSPRAAHVSDSVLARAFVPTGTQTGRVTPVRLWPLHGSAPWFLGYHTLLTLDHDLPPSWSGADHHTLLTRTPAPGTAAGQTAPPGAYPDFEYGSTPVGLTLLVPDCVVDYGIAGEKKFRPGLLSVTVPQRWSARCVRNGT